MTVCVIEHEKDAPPGLVARPGMEVRIVRPYAGDEIPTPGELDGFTGLVVLGGEMGANDDDSHAWLAPTKTLIAAAVRREVPTLLICLGHQLGAVALGGTVTRSPLGPMWGVVPVGRTEAGEDDDLLRHLPADAAAVHWNGDLVVDPPPGAVVLARDPRGGIQAVRYGHRAWGVQCHPEVGAEIVTRWGGSVDADRDPAAAARRDVALAQVGARETELRATWIPVLDAFAAMTTGGVVMSRVTGEAP
ncbi:type 1 glutamine amidotransferase [Mobilicoccus massiliensis]|uniref:type 1 glutamine amidotransferase n=1 Tax=Mobilicoccus massiliensis TaxID=1522310 RepID=UPI000693F68F|nr:type 1 glutamine amidotransferase [Mobilicoccus massiliensis]